MNFCNVQKKQYFESAPNLYFIRIHIAESSNNSSACMFLVSIVCARARTLVGRLVQCKHLLNSDSSQLRFFECGTTIFSFCLFNFFL